MATVGKYQGSPFLALGVQSCQVGLKGEEGREVVFSRESEGGG